MTEDPACPRCHEVLREDFSIREDVRRWAPGSGIRGWVCPSRHRVTWNPLIRETRPRWLIRCDICEGWLLIPQSSSPRVRHAACQVVADSRRQWAAERRRLTRKG